jgi:hypothetical protein
MRGKIVETTQQQKEAPIALAATTNQLTFAFHAFWLVVCCAEANLSFSHSMVTA